MAEQLAIPRLLRSPGLWIPEPPGIPSRFRFRLWISRVWLSRRPPFGGLVAWGRVRYRACWLSFGLEFTLNALRRLLPARANASVKSIAPVRMGDPAIAAVARGPTALSAF